MKIGFSDHALVRIQEKERVTLGWSEIHQLFEKNSFIRLTNDRRVGRGEYLFYSHKDLRWFIAVVSEKDSEIVTILTYRNVACWKMVTSAMLEHARELAGEKRFSLTPAPVEPDPAPEKTAPSTYYFNAQIELRDGRVESVGLLKLRNAAGRSFEDLEGDLEIKRQLREKLSHLPTNQRVLSLSCRYGKKGPPHIFPFF